MKILWLTWKDLKHPQAGGAERVNEELAKRLVRNGDEVIFLVAGFPGAKDEETIDGYKVIRVGGRWTVYWKAYRYYKNNLQGWADLIIDEVNTMPFFAELYAKEKNILFVHQLCREIWFYQMFFPLSNIGYALEPYYLRALYDREVITVSQSTKKDLLKLGFREDKINIISEGIDIEPAVNLEKIEKYEKPTLLSFGSVRGMKRTDHIVKAFEIAKEANPDLELIIAGDYDNPFGKKVLALAKKSQYADSINFLGKVDKNKKIELFQKSYILLVTSVKEGWGLIVTEAGSQGTPAIVYDADGLRDSVRHNETGLICRKNSPEMMAENIGVLLKDNVLYERMRHNAWQWSKEINFEKAFEEFGDYILFSKIKSSTFVVPAEAGIQDKLDERSVI